jgi:DmsE family decaheme c-type cytochrome
MRNARKRILFAVLIPTLTLTAIILLPSLLPGQVKAGTEGVPKPAPGDFVGSDTCKTCHVDQAERFSATSMGKLFLKQPRTARERLGCEGCHGPGRAHAESGGSVTEGLITFSRKDPTPVAQRNAVCLECHEKTARLHWQGSPHESRDLSCTNCHRVMETLSDRHQLAKATEIETCGQCHLQRRAQLMRSSHMPVREGKMTCTSCHNPHGTVTEKLLKANSVNENCYSCHAEKRGPFLWEHPPVTESCTNCHEPHGSNHEKLLKVAKPRLCQQCHVETRHPTRPSDPTTRFVFNRACTNCHSQVHGSNHPSGRPLNR